MPVVRYLPPGTAPDSTDETDATTPLTAAELAAILQVEQAVALRLLSVANELVAEYAPTAPLAVRREAVIRCSGWLLGSPSSGVRRESAGPLDVSYSPGMTGALRASGAAGLLTSWKRRRGGAI